MLVKKSENDLNSKDIKDIMESGAHSPEEQVARLEMMLEVSRTFNATLDLNALLRLVSAVAMQLTDTEAAAILLLERKNGDFYFEMSLSESSEPVIAPFDNSLAGWIVKNGEALVIDKAEKRHFSEFDALPLEIQAVLGVPLIIKEKTIGVIELFNKQGETTFNGDDIHTLTTLAGQAAAAIENTRFFVQRDRLDSVFNELQSPMRSIIGSSQVLLANPTMDVKDLRIGLERINFEATQLTHMVNDFLDLTKIETGRVRMDKRPVDLGALAQEVIDLFYPQALEQNVTLSLNMERPVPAIPADAKRLKQVIANLVDNAIKYNRQGGQVEVTVLCNQLRAQVSVRDTGKGITPKELGLVFDKFYRGQADISRGAGLGLPLAKMIIEAHGGDIWVQSEEGIGSNFTFSLPLLDNCE